MNLTCPRCGVTDFLEDPFDKDMVLCGGCKREWWVTTAFGRLFFSRLEPLGRPDAPPSR